MKVPISLLARGYTLHMAWFVYVLHFDRPDAGGSQHYVGMTQDVSRRLQNHQDGVLSTYVHNAVRAGRTFELVGWWRVPDDREARKVEKRAKTLARFLCPHCSPAVAAYRRLQATGSAVPPPPVELTEAA